LNAFVFPAGEEKQRHRITVHRLTEADPPRTWSVKVNRDKVSAGDLAFLWQTVPATTCGGRAYGGQEWCTGSMGGGRRTGAIRLSRRCTPT